MTQSMAGPTDKTALSAAARSVWAKSERGHWLQLAQHMTDAAGMAGRLYDEWLAPSLRAQWSECFPGGESDARTIFVFLAGAHDCGKASPVFVAQVETLAQRCRDAGLPCRRMEDLKLDRAVLPHATVSSFVLQTWLTERGVERDVSRQLVSIVGAHHGKPAQLDAKNLHRAHAFGGDVWAAVRQELLDWLAGETGATDVLGRLGAVQIPWPVQVTMCGLLVMADWMASNQTYFPLIALDPDVSPALPQGSDLAARFSAGWNEAALPQAWAPAEPTEPVNELFARRFNWKSEWSPHALQRDAVNLVREHDVGLMIVEAEMGGGKTETALAVAEILAAQAGAHGLLVALPTQATTDAMFGRVVPWIENLPEPPQDVPAWAMTLGHGKAALNPLFRSYADAFKEAASDERALIPVSGVMDAEPGESEPEGSAVVAHEWFAGRKRRLLANFGVVTIDQILMGALQQKHLMVRHLALAGKVLIVDECHASDSYMNVYMDRLLHWLGHYRTPVILLSATLTRERKEAMIRAYAPQIDAIPPAGAYPCLTWVDRDRRSAHAHVVNQQSTPRSVSWAWASPDDDDIIALLRDELSEGGCALVVRNTVKDAQRLADALRAAEVAPDVFLVHSRYLAADRAQNDRALLAKFGPKSGLGSRPEKAIVVATQVVEQSLDVDFDVLVTDLAPVDLVLQRIGRLHRHPWRRRPAKLRDARVHILATPDDDGVIHATTGSEFVYAVHHLLRSAWVLQAHGHQFTLPDDIAPVVQRALGEEKLPVADEAWVTAMAAAAKRFQKDEDKRQTAASRMALRRFEADEDGAMSLLNNEWLDLTSDFSEAAMQSTVRDARPSLEVVVALVDPDGLAAMSPPWMPDPVTIDVSTVPDDETAHRIASWTLKLPQSITDKRGIDAVLAELAATTRQWRWNKHPLLKRQPILVMSQTNEGSHVFEATLAGRGEERYLLRYDPARGLEEVHDDVQSD